MVCMGERIKTETKIKVTKAGVVCLVGKVVHVAFLCCWHICHFHEELLTQEPLLATLYIGTYYLY